RAGSILVLIFLWWVAAKLVADTDILPGPLLILETIWHNLTTLGPEEKSAYFHIGITLGRIFLAFAAAMLLGVGIGLFMGIRKIVEQSFLALIPLALTMPTILMVFLAVLWFGFNELGSLVAVMAVV